LDKIKIAIVGAGGVGGYYGGLLAHHGHRVSMIARGAHLAAMRANGLQVRSVHGDFSVNTVQATDRPEDVGPVDWVLFCVKATDTEVAAEAMRPMVGPRTTVASLQNGVDAAQRIGRIVGMEHTVGGATWIASAVEAPGTIRQLSGFRRVVLGELDGEATSRVRAMVAALQACGVTAEISTDIRRVLWTKMVFIAPFSAVGSLTRLPVGRYRHIPETRWLMVNLMHEVAAVARADGAALDDDVVSRTLELLDSTAAEVKPSMQRDVESGRPSEVESLVGVIGRLGRERGVPTPAMDLVYAALRPAALQSAHMPSGR